MGRFTVRVLAVLDTDGRAPAFDSAERGRRLAASEKRRFTLRLFRVHTMAALLVALSLPAAASAQAQQSAAAPVKIFAPLDSYRVNEDRADDEDDNNVE